jgi:hypothetical protein
MCSTFTYADDEMCALGTWCGAGGICVDPVGEPCDNSEHCPDGLVCLDPNGGGVSMCSPPFSTGGLCAEDLQCESGLCVDGVCCQTACNGPCERCDEVPGLCTPASGASGECGVDQACVNGACEVVPQPGCATSCAAGMTCVNDSCVPNDGLSCTDNQDCNSGLCFENTCISPPD